MESQIVVSLTPDEALVLFEALASGVTQHAVTPGTQRALDSIECQLERVLVQPFKRNYLELVADAERRLSQGTE